MRALRALIALSAGCGRIGFDPAGDALGGDALGPWSAGSPIPGASMTGMNEQDVSGANSKLELFFTKGSDVDMFTMTRATVDDPWGAPQLVPLSTVGAEDGGARLSPDDLTIYFDSHRPGGLGLGDVWVATRTAPDQPWGAPTLMPDINTAGIDKWFSICRDGRYVMVRDVGDDEIFEGTLGGGPPTIVPILNSPKNDTATFMTDDCSTVFFGSERNVSHDIMVAERQQDGSWGAPRVFNEVCDDIRDEADPWLSADGHLFLYASNAAGMGGKDLYEVIR